MRTIMGFVAVEAVCGAAFSVAPDQAECGNPIVYAKTNENSYTMTWCNVGKKDQMVKFSGNGCSFEISTKLMLEDTSSAAIRAALAGTNRGGFNDLCNPTPTDKKSAASVAATFVTNKSKRRVQCADASGKTVFGFYEQGTEIKHTGRGLPWTSSKELKACQNLMEKRARLEELLMMKCTKGDIREARSSESYNACPGGNGSLEVVDAFADCTLNFANMGDLRLVIGLEAGLSSYVFPQPTTGTSGFEPIENRTRPLCPRGLVEQVPGIEGDLHWPVPGYQSVSCVENGLVFATFQHPLARLKGMGYPSSVCGILKDRRQKILSLPRASAACVDESGRPASFEHIGKGGSRNYSRECSDGSVEIHTLADDGSREVCSIQIYHEHPNMDSVKTESANLCEGFPSGGPPLHCKDGTPGEIRVIVGAPADAKKRTELCAYLVNKLTLPTPGN